MVALAAQPILTTIGRVAVPKLADTLVRTGANKFVKQYGQKAFEAVLGTTAGLKAYKETEEYLSEYLNHIDEGGEEGSFVPKGSMPDTDRMTQMDAAMAVPNVNESVRETGQGLVIGGEAKEILPPPEPFSTPIDSQTATILSTPIPEKVDTTLSTPIPEKIDTKESFPDLSGELSKPIIYYNEKVGKKMLTKESTDYRLQHKPRGPDDEYPVRLDDLTQTTTGESAGYPKDFYSEKGKRIYAPGQSFEGDEFGIANNESYSIINSVKGNPDAEVTIYRAVPNEKNITKINSGDFVTLSKRYADLHGAGGYGTDGTDSGKVLELKVKVKDIYWDQNDVNEFGYFPEKNKDVSDQTDKLVRGIGDNNISKQTEELVPKIKNKIQTWEDYFPDVDAAKKAVEDEGGTLEEFNNGLIQRQINFRKTQDGMGISIYFNKKYIGELTEADPYNESPELKIGNTKSYNLRYIDSTGFVDEPFTTLDGQKYAKERTKEIVARDLMSNDEGSLRELFQNMEYTKNGEPKAADEAVKQATKNFALKIPK